MHLNYLFFCNICPDSNNIRDIIRINRFSFWRLYTIQNPSETSDRSISHRE